MVYHLITPLFFLSTTPPTELPHYTIQTKKGPHRIYLTIDDHPNKYTFDVLKVLKRCKLKATFFVWGAPERYYRINPRWKPNKRMHDALIAIHRAGHTLGNHTVTHANLCKLRRSRIRWELKTTQDLVRQATGVTLEHWRPPLMVLCRKVKKEARRLKLKLVWAHVDDLRSSAWKMWRYVKARIRWNKKYTIILVHKKARRLAMFLRLAGLCPPKGK